MVPCQYTDSAFEEFLNGRLVCWGGGEGKAKIKRVGVDLTRRTRRTRRRSKGIIKKEK